MSKERERLRRQLRRLAFSRPNDGIRIALGEDADVEGMRLEGVSEFKRGAGGAIEVRFFDPLKAMELLLELEREDRAGQDGVGEFLRSLAEERP